MRKRIYRISEDKFDDLKPNIEFGTERIEAQCFCDEEFEGSFSFKSINGVSARGVVYCDNPYVKIIDPQFEGELIVVSYSIPDLHAQIGEVISGNFTIITVGIEKTIPFSVTYTKRPLMCSAGELHSLREFADFAQGRFSEAVSIFYSDAFEKFLEDHDKKTRLLYRGFKSTAISSTNVDEFLVSCGLKATMTFDIKERQDEYFGVTENIRGEIEILRSTWGYIDICVSSDADFVSVEKEHITSDFFLGSVFNMNYYIHKEKMHAGINYARISFDYRDIHREITIKATSTPEGVILEHPQHEKNKAILKLWRTYEDFRLRKISAGQWSVDTIELLDTISGDGFSENTILLFKALVLITNKQRQEALWIIQDLKRTIENKRSVQWAFLLYLCTLIEREESYVDRITADIEDIFKANSDSLQMFWFLLFLRKDYIKNPTLKLRDIASWISDGYESVALYIEAYYVFLQDPYLIATFDDFTIKVLNWAKKHDAITRDIAIQMIHVLESERKYNPKAIDILEKCYEIYPDLQLLLAMVTYMLKAPQSDDRFFYWYKLAIESNLHVAGIFEAYINALSSQSVDKLPQLVTMFFRYNNNLTYEKKALLYANIILHKDEDPETYEQYERTIENFAVEQLKLGRLDDNLAICYQQLLEIGIFDNEIARIISGIIFRKKVAVIYPNIRRVILYQDEFKSPTLAGVSDHQAYLLYMGTEGVIFLEDKDGHLIADDNGYLVEEVIDPSGYIGRLRELAPQAFPFLLNDFANKQSAEDFELEDVEVVEQFIHANQLSTAFRLSLYPKLIEFLCNINREDILEKHFLHEAKLQELPAETLAKVLDVLVARSKYEEAYRILQEYNCSMVDIKTATKLCRFMIEKSGNAPQDFLITLCANLVSKNVVHKDMTYYLVKNYVGPTDLLVKIFEDAFEDGQDIVEFAERIIVQSLYRDFLPADIMAVFDSYMVRKTNRMIVEAFLTYQAHAYLSKEIEVSESIFAYIYSRIQKAQPVNESMRIALMKYLCVDSEPDEDDLSMLDMLVADAIYRNQYFGFFSKCDRRLQIKYHLYDKYFVEYKCETSKNVSIIYSINGGTPVEEDMIEMYDELFVKEFVLFFGDELKYEIYCDDISEDPLVNETHINSDTLSESVDGRYSMMNNLKRLRLYQDKDELAAQLKRYQGLDAVSKDLFTMI